LSEHFLEINLHLSQNPLTGISLVEKQVKGKEALH